MTRAIPPLKQITDYLNQYAVERPGQDAVVFEQQRLSYTQLQTQVTDFAKALLAAGIEKGDRVAVLSTCRLEYWITFLATTQIGGIWLGLNPKYQEQECRYVLEDAKPKLLLVMAEFEGRSYQPIVDIAVKDYPFIKQVIGLTEFYNGQLLSHTVSFSAFLNNGKHLAEQQLTERQQTIDKMDPALLVYTSGSTGKPKGALLSHYGLCFGASAQSRQFNLDPARSICSFPINHVACVADTCCVILVDGGTLILQERFDPALVLKTIEQEQITSLGGVPTMLLMLLDHPEFSCTDFSSVQMIGWGGAALPIYTIKRLQPLAPRLTCVYGMTETATNTTFTSPDADLSELSETIGRPDPAMPCRIVNGEGKACAVGEAGELQFKGEYLLLEYLNRPEATKEVYTEDGWLHTGDLGYWRENGTITLVGRLSDMFKSGGYNVYPREIENLLESHPAIAMAVVVSVPDSKFQEVGAAFVMITDGLDEISVDIIKTFCSAHLANYKIPKYFYLVDSLPTLPVGKVDRVALKRMALERTGSAEKIDHTKDLQ